MKKGQLLTHTLAKQIELAILDAIEHKKRPVFLFLLYLCSLPFKMCVFIRNLAFSLGLKRSRKLATKVISIGNITAGGTGKTPFSLMLLEALDQKMKCALLSSGYRRTTDQDGLVDVQTKNAQEVGDEAFMIAKVAPETDVYSVKDRKKFFQNFEASNYDLFFLDDGLQKRDIQRDIDIVCMRSKDLFGSGYFLPRGLLRDSPKRLKEADLVSIYGVNSEKEYQSQVAILRRYTQAPIIGANMSIIEAQNQEGQLVELKQGLRVAAFCATASPQSFFDSVVRQNVKLVGTLKGADHLPFSAKQLKEFTKECLHRGVEALVCTQKDWVKLPRDLDLDLPIYTLIGKLKIEYGIRYFDLLINQISSWKS